MTNSKRNIWVIDDVYGASDSQGQFYQREFLGRFSRPNIAFTFFSGRDEFLNEYAVSALETYMSQPELKRPDLILLDVNFGPLPLGYDFLTWLGLNHPEIPVVMLTSLERDANLKQALDLGAVDFISKSEERPQVFWGVVERYLAADRNEWLIGQHGQFLQALYLLQRFAQGDRHCLLLQGLEPSEKTAAVAYVGRLLSEAPVTLSANAIEKTDLSKAQLVVIADADECELPAQVALAEKIKTLPSTTRVIATTTDYLAARVKVGEVDRSFYDLISEEVVHLPSLRERLSDVGHLLRHAIAGQPGAKRHVRSPPDWVVERAMTAPALVELSDIRSVAAAVVAFAGNRDSLERELDGLLGSPVTGETGAPTREGSREQISDVERFLERVASHRSVYTVEHDGAELVVFPDVFSPRYSHSSDFLIQMLPVRPGDRVVDVGCGTGVLGIAALRRGAEHATFIDVNPAAVSNTQTNLDRLGLASRGRIVLSDVYENLEGKFDLIISNPPFWNKPAATMLERSCYDENYTFLRKLIEGAALRARDGARLAIVMSNQSDTALVQRLLAKYGWSVRDHRMAAARTGRGGSNHVRVAWVCDRDPEV